MTPNGIQETLGLRNGVDYARLSIPGHFGEFGEELPWEKTDKAQELLLYCEGNFYERKQEPVEVKQDTYDKRGRSKHNGGKKKRR